MGLFGAWALQGHKLKWSYKGGPNPIWLVSLEEAEIWTQTSQGFMATEER